MALNERWMHTKNGDISFGLGLLWGAAGGALGSYLSSPFFMVRRHNRRKLTVTVTLPYKTL